MIGAGEMIGGVGLIGPIRDKFGNMAALFVLLIVTAAGLVIIFIYNQRDVYDLLAYLMCFVWGL